MLAKICAIESRSGTAGFDPFRYEARGYPLKVDGESVN
ncbi:hypothetical protein THERMOS_1346 [Bathymodiolus thermophilus thioautotrophic gill symbiont]|uniref:Uncharacterized protein n=1 Tax=Bathymodiolus thermophilus thioautotrophic gill symbiont TaxID=2360 RepID=A0A8H9CFV8_9GAMM|nr:hypothetical protein THERMOS_1346 [Bathymodiolus thermophilus thioautotrophic gill symbiont]